MRNLCIAVLLCHVPLNNKTSKFMANFNFGCESGTSNQIFSIHALRMLMNQFHWANISMQKKTLHTFA